MRVGVARPDEEERWNRLVRERHYPGFRNFCGRRLRHVATLGDEWLALVGWHAAALHCAARDRWIGWSSLQRRQRLFPVAHQSRFLLLTAPGAAPRLASRVFGLALRRLPATGSRCTGTQCSSRRPSSTRRASPAPAAAPRTGPRPASRPASGAPAAAAAATLPIPMIVNSDSCRIRCSRCAGICSKCCRRHRSVEFKRLGIIYESGETPGFVADAEPGGTARGLTGRCHLRGSGCGLLAARETPLRHAFEAQPLNREFRHSRI